MGTQNSFDLNQELARWRSELAEQGVRAAEANELESHLHESAADLQKRGLNEEEAFWIARHRLGSAPDLAEQFAQADPARVWRERIFWAAALTLGCLFWMQIWGLGINWVTDLLGSVGLQGTWNYLARQLVTLLPLPIIAILVARGSLLKICAVLMRPFRTQRQFATASALTVACMLGVMGLNLWHWSVKTAQADQVAVNVDILGSLVVYAVWPVTLVVIMFGIAPRRRPAEA